MAVLVTLGGAAAAPVASADTYCVHHATNPCTTSGPTVHDEGSDLQTALDDALNRAGADDVLIGPGTFTKAAGFYYQYTDAVTVTGAGADVTVLKADPGSAAVLTLHGPEGTTLSDVTIDGTGQASYGLYMASPEPVTVHSAATATHVKVINGSGSFIAAFLKDGATLSGSELHGGDLNGVAIQADRDGATLLDDRVSGYTGVLSLIGADVAARRLTVVDVVSLGLRSAGGQMTVDGLLLHKTGGFAVGADGGGKMTLRSATLIGQGPTTRAFDVESTTATTSALTVTNSILRGFTDLGVCFGNNGGTANLTLGFDDVHVGTTACSGPGTFTPGTGNVDIEPGFVDEDAGDYRLRFDSELIDAGDPTCQMLCQNSDLDHLTRPVDGDNDGTATRDIGAYEYQRRAPVAVATADPTSAITAQTVSFSAAGSSDADHGDSLTYAWSFDDGGAATGQAVTHAFAAGGAHTGTVTVTDSAGAASTAVASVSVTAPAVVVDPPVVIVPPVVIAPLPVRDTVPPALSKVSLSPSTFRVSSRSTATSAKAPKGSSIRFTLSEKAKVVVTIKAVRGGITVGKSCVAPSRKHPRGKRCDRTVGTLTRAVEPAGSDRIAFSGRIGRKALARGRYIVSLVATDAAGNRSPAKTAKFTIA